MNTTVIARLSIKRSALRILIETTAIQRCESRAIVIAHSLCNYFNDVSSILCPGMHILNTSRHFSFLRWTRLSRKRRSLIRGSTCGKASVAFFLQDNVANGAPSLVISRRGAKYLHLGNKVGRTGPESGSSSRFESTIAISSAFRLSFDAGLPNKSYSLIKFSRSSFALEIARWKSGVDPLPYYFVVCVLQVIT